MEKLLKVMQNGKDVHIFKPLFVSQKHVSVKEIPFEEITNVSQVWKINDTPKANWGWAHMQDPYPEDFKMSAAAFECYMHHVNHLGDKGPFFVVIVDDQVFVVR